MFDANGDGTIDISELNDVMKSLGELVELTQFYSNFLYRQILENPSFWVFLEGIALDDGPEIELTVQKTS